MAACRVNGFLHRSCLIVVFAREAVFVVKYRRRFQIIADIIGVTEKGAKKTKIMYFANLSHLLLQRYLADAVRVGFLRTGGDLYLVTAKGEEFLDRYLRFSRRASQVEADLEALRSESEELEKMCRSGRGKACRRSRLAILG